MNLTAAKATFQKYSAYKDSGVDWLGEIPENWELLSNKNIFKLKKNQVGKKSANYVLLSLTLKGIIQRVIEDGGKFPAEFDTYQEVKKGDFVFCLFDVEETPRCVGLSDFEGMITGAYTVMEVNQNWDKGFLYYFYLNLDADKRMRPLYTGLRNTISKDNFFAFKTFKPPLQEQTAIAVFLDDKTAKIDGAIAQKEKMIALLKERKQIIIQNAVTKGLNPNAKMKDSGVEWIGEIPEEWEVKKIKNVTSKIGSGVTPSGGGTTYLDVGGIPLLRSQNIHFGRIDFTDVARISENVHQSMSNSQVKIGDVLLNITGGSIGRCHFVEVEEPLNVNQHVCIVRPKKIDTKFLNFVLASNIGQGQIWFFQQGGGREGLNFQALKNFFIPYPTYKEQTAIVVHIEAQSAKTDKAIKLQEQQIEKLKELKSTMIDGAVTGKIKV
jgi:type I restriction enzyme, S subunit